MYGVWKVRERESVCLCVHVCLLKKSVVVYVSGACVFVEKSVVVYVCFWGDWLVQGKSVCVCTVHKQGC